MTKLNDLFEEFISNIEPDEDAVDFAHKAHEPVREFLEKDKEFGEYFEKSFLYGSYKRHTAVGDIKDVDIMVLTKFDPNSEDHTPNKVLRKLKSALARYYKDPENPEYQRRSIRINQPLTNKNVELTLDIIPAVAQNGEDNPLLVPDREQKEWIRSHPKGHIKHTTNLNKDEVSEGRFVPLVKIMKSWWKYQCTVIQPQVKRPRPKGFWIECFTGENLDTTAHGWADHFIAVLTNVYRKYSTASEVPELKDPGLQNETVKTSMTKEEFRIFMNAVSDSLVLAQKAVAENDDFRSSKIWQEIFGDEYPLSDLEEKDLIKASLSEIMLGNTSHARKPEWPEHTGKYRLNIQAFVCDPSTRKVKSRLTNDGRVIPSGCGLKFIAKTNAPKPYEVHWQVVNTGKHSVEKNGLRGNFFTAKRLSNNPSPDPLINWEHTEYTGKHWIECFIVKDNWCIARSGRFYIKIKNSNYLCS